MVDPLAVTMSRLVARNAIEAHLEHSQPVLRYLFSKGYPRQFYLAASLFDFFAGFVHPNVVLADGTILSFVPRTPLPGSSNFFECTQFQADT